jgi:hypothetical protein
MDGAGVASKPGKTEKRAAELTAAKSEILRLAPSCVVPKRSATFFEISCTVLPPPAPRRQRLEEPSTANTGSAFTGGVHFLAL